MKGINLEPIGYTQPIPDSGWVAEVIDERFDNASCLMSKHSVIYGGAVRDALAGKPLLGDLDIAVPSSEYKWVVEQFMRNPRWIPGKAENKNTFGSNLSLAAKKLIGIDLGTNNYTKSDSDVPPPVAATTEFVNADGMNVQVICSRYEGSSLVQAGLYPARMVDIICCGVIMNFCGEIMEVVPDAYKDCREGILRLNEDSDTIYTKTLPDRVKKLEARGWVNMVDVEKAIRDIKAERERRQRRKRLRAKQTGEIRDDLFKTYLFGPDADRILSGGYKRSYTTHNTNCSTEQLIRHIGEVAIIIGRSIRVVRLPDDRLEVMTKNENVSRMVYNRVSKFLSKMREDAELVADAVADGAPKPDPEKKRKSPTPFIGAATYTGRIVGREAVPDDPEFTISERANTKRYRRPSAANEAYIRRDAAEFDRWSGRVFGASKVMAPASRADFAADYTSPMITGGITRDKDIIINGRGLLKSIQIKTDGGKTATVMVRQDDVGEFVGAVRDCPLNERVAFVQQWIDTHR